MDADALAAKAHGRITQHRTADAELRLVDASGRPLPGVQARVRLARHEFKLGANAFKCCGVEDAGLQKSYRERFSALLNFATLPFYWGRYEPEKGRTIESQLDEMVEWCERNHITPKGHPLVWHEVFPGWAGDLEDAEVLGRLEKRVREIVSRFAGRIDIWDIVNEATVSQRFENAVGRWIGARGAAACVAEALRWAREANPESTLLYNDFNVSEDFEELGRALVDMPNDGLASGKALDSAALTPRSRGRHASVTERGEAEGPCRGRAIVKTSKAPMDVVGIQSHMHVGPWPLEKVWAVCETYSRFGLPLHFTELTVLSGRLKGPDDKDWHKVHEDWESTHEGEEAQAEYGEKLYTLLFSHPAVEAVTWWDFSDYKSWQGAPSGLVREDMTRKPLYDRLFEMFHRRWVTNIRAEACAEGRLKVRCFFGEHVVQGRTPSGDELRGSFELRRAGPRELDVVLG